MTSEGIPVGKAARGRIKDLWEHIPGQAKNIGIVSAAVGTVTGGLYEAIKYGGLVYAFFTTPQVSLPQIPSGISVAVSPFMSLSPELEQSVPLGIEVAIDEALAGVRNVQVLSRSSAKQFQEANVDVRETGRKLGLKYLVEGWVQSKGKSILVGADLVRIEDGVRLWTQTYDYQSSKANLPRDMATVIVKSVAKTLNLPLVAQPKILPIDEMFDQLFSEAEAAVRQRVFPGAVEKSKTLTERYPQYGPAWELLAQAYRSQQTYDPMLRSGSRNEAREFGALARSNAQKAALQAIRVDPQSAIAYSILASVEAQSGLWPAAVDHGKRAFEINPNDPNVLHDFSQILAITGHIKEALIQRERLLKLDSTAAAYGLVTADILQINGRREEAIRILESIPADGPQSYFRNVFLARAYAVEKRYGQAAEALLRIVGDQVSAASVQEAAELLRQAPAKGKPERPLEGELNFVYLHIGAPDHVLDNVERYIESGNMTATGLRALWAPEFAPIRKLERFKTLIRKAHMYDYWRERGWPDLCRPSGDEDFTCD